ncbi:MAG: GNAT family N-acetyltransferase [Proteobacteria bacterium]|nr:GNAT family N-acetyltransferase [Pseudomonadota bacterium]
MSLPTMRRAELPDAKQLALLAEATFRDTFAVMNTPEDMALHCRTSYGEVIQAREIADPRMLTLICEDGGKSIGFAQLRWGEAPSCVVARAPGEILRLYVARDYHGRGVAHQLMRACVHHMTEHSSDVVWLGVWERNPRAISFYKKSGFTEVGEHIFRVGSDPQRDIVMARALV